jgi:hypothetical protein
LRLLPLKIVHVVVLVLEEKPRTTTRTSPRVLMGKFSSIVGLRKTAVEPS